MHLSFHVIPLPSEFLDACFPLPGIPACLVFPSPPLSSNVFQERSAFCYHTPSPMAWVQAQVRLQRGLGCPSYRIWGWDKAAGIPTLCWQQHGTCGGRLSGDLSPTPVQSISQHRGCISLGVTRLHGME